MEFNKAVSFMVMVAHAFKIEIEKKGGSEQVDIWGSSCSAQRWARTIRSRYTFIRI